MFKTKLMKSMKVGVAALVGVTVLSTSVLVNAATVTDMAKAENGDISDSKYGMNKYGMTGAFQFIPNGNSERWVTIKACKGNKTKLIDSKNNVKEYNEDELGHANDATYYNGELLVAAAGTQGEEKYLYGTTSEGTYPIMRIYADTSKSNLYTLKEEGYKFNKELKGIISTIQKKEKKEVGVGGITYIPGKKYNNYPVFVLKCGNYLIKTYLHGEKFGFISYFKLEYPTPVGKTEKTKLVGQGVTYYDGKIYMAFGVKEGKEKKSEEKCDNRMLVGSISFDELKKKKEEKDGAKRELETYINEYKKSYTTFEMECISFKKDGTMYFSANGIKNGQQSDKVVKVKSVEE